MRWPVLVLPLLAASGCDQVFGLRDPDVAPDAPPVHITGHVTRRYVHMGGVDAGLAIEEQPSDPPVVRIAGATVPVLWTPATGTFEYTGLDGVPSDITVGGTTYESVARVIDLADTVLGRPDQVAPSSTTTFSYSISGIVPANDNVSLTSTGVWSATKPVQAGSLFTVRWPDAGFFQAAPALLNQERGDRVQLARFAKIDNDYTALTEFTENAVSLAASTMTSISATLSPLTRDACVRMLTDKAAEAARIHTTYPLLPAPTSAFTLYQVPAPEHGATALYGIAAGGSLTDDVTAYVAFPYVGLTPVVELSTGTARFAGASRVSAGSGYLQVVTPSAACVPIELGRMHDAPLPIKAALSGTDLAIDDQVVGVAATGDPVLTWELANGSADVYVVTLHDTAPVTSAQIPPRVLMTARRELRLPREALLPDHTYVVTIFAWTGMPGAAAGDFTTWRYPSAFGYASASPFKMPPAR